jgi:hypothetical protein
MMGGQMVVAMCAGVVCAGVVCAGVSTGMLFAMVSAGMMFSAVMTPAVMSPSMMAATVTTAMTPTAASEHGRGKQYPGQRGQSAANGENRQFPGAANDFLPIRRCGALEILALGRQLDEGFHRATFLESGAK